jgi:hypothetical protein
MVEEMWNIIRSDATLRRIMAGSHSIVTETPILKGWTPQIASQFYNVYCLGNVCPLPSEIA